MPAFDCFDEIRCIHRANLPGVRTKMEARFAKLGIADRVRAHTAVSTPGNPAVSQVLSHRQLIAEAQAAGRHSVLVFEQDVLFLDRSCAVIQAAAGELDRVEWRTCRLGGVPRTGELLARPGLTHWRTGDCFGFVHALAHHQRVYEKILADIPADFDGVHNWLQSASSLETYFATLADNIVLVPRIATLASLLPYEDPADHASFTI